MHPTFFLVSDSAVTRILYGKMFENNKEVNFLGAARFNEAGITKMLKVSPDFLLVDLDNIPKETKDGIADLRKKYCGKVIIILSKDQEEDGLFSGDEKGIRLIKRPELIDLSAMEAFKTTINQLIKSVNGTYAITSQSQVTSQVKPKTSIHNMYSEMKRQDLSPLKLQKNKKIICIGTSTGGPGALQKVLTKLPKGMEAPIVIVQHMPPSFTKSLANRLNSICEIDVKEAEDGERLVDGIAYIAPGGKHLTIHPSSDDLIIKISEDPPVNGHRPSVDVMFHSLSLIEDYAKIAVIMTGMGADGAAGLIELKKQGKLTAIAEAEESCIVYGMPKAAISTGCVDTIAEINDIASNILKYTKKDVGKWM